MLNLEKNARLLIGVLAEHFPSGSGCEDLRLKFEKIANRSHATFYACLKFAKSKGWITADGRTYTLAADGCWRSPPLGADIERHQFEHVLASRKERIRKLEWTNRRLKDSRKAIAAGEAALPAVSALVSIMEDAKIPVRARVQAAEQLLSFKSPPDIAESAKVFLASIFTDPEQNIDHRLAATTALRRSEDVRIMPPIERPPPRTDDNSAEEIVPLRELVRRRREAYAASLREQQLAALKPGASNGGGGDDDTAS